MLPFSVVMFSTWVYSDNYVAWTLDTTSMFKTGYRHYGLELVDGKVRDNLACGVVEPAISKIKSLRFATEAAITILRIGED